MTTARFEQFLARLYVDDDARRSFASDPRGAAARAGLTSREIEALAKMDWTGLELASRSFASKRLANARSDLRRSARFRAAIHALVRAFGWRR